MGTTMPPRAAMQGSRAPDGRQAPSTISFLISSPLKKSDMKPSLTRDRKLRLWPPITRPDDRSQNWSQPAEKRAELARYRQHGGHAEKHAPGPRVES